MKQTYRVHADRGHDYAEFPMPPLPTWEEVEAGSPIEAADLHGKEKPEFPWIRVAYRSGSAMETLFSVIHSQPIYTVSVFQNGYHNDEPRTMDHAPEPTQPTTH